VTAAWILILYVAANGVGLTNVPGFASQAACRQAGAAAVVALGGTMRPVRFVCVSTKEAP
jgi:hypothetical protein